MKDEIRKAELKPCPFCGADHIKWYGTNGDNIYCRNCGAEGPTPNSNDNEAVQWWNKRQPEITTLTEQVKDLRDENNRLKEIIKTELDSDTPLTAEEWITHVSKIQALQKTQGDIK